MSVAVTPPMSRDTSLEARNSTVQDRSDTIASSSLDPVSNEVREAVQVVVLFILSGVTSLFGTGANIVNIAVFVKQGFKDSINVSLLGLAVADLGCVLTMFWMSLCHSPWLLLADLSFNPLDVLYVTGGWPHVYFNSLALISTQSKLGTCVEAKAISVILQISPVECPLRITSLITAFISVERCLCVTVPLKVKTIITHSRTKIIITSIFTFAAVIFSPMFYANQLRWLFSSAKNRTQLSLVFTEDRVLIETITLPIYSVIMSGASLVTVAVCTAILIVKLKEKTKWRNESIARGASTMDNITSRDRKVLQMVTLISSIFVICYTPATVNFLLMAYAPEFSLVGKYGNVFFVVWCVTLLVEVINSSVNIFIYLKMSSKFRNEFFHIFCCAKHYS